MGDIQNTCLKKQQLEAKKLNKDISAAVHHSEREFSVSTAKLTTY